MLTSECAIRVAVATVTTGAIGACSLGSGGVGVQIETDTLQLWGGSVSSDRLTNLTNGAWSPEVGNEQVPECPGGCRVDIQFSSPYS